jgi:hypothetical protein
LREIQAIKQAKNIHIHFFRKVLVTKLAQELCSFCVELEGRRNLIEISPIEVHLIGKGPVGLPLAVKMLFCFI